MNLLTYWVLHNIPYLNDPSKAEQAQSGSRLREMNLYSEIVRDTSINTVSTPKYHPLFFSPPSKGEKDTQITDSFRRTCRLVCLKPCVKELLSPPAGGRGILPCGIKSAIFSGWSEIPQGEGEGDLFSSLPASSRRADRQTLILREQAGQQLLRDKNGTSFGKIESGSHWTTPL